MEPLDVTVRARLQELERRANAMETRLEQRVTRVQSEIWNLRTDIAQASAVFWMNLLKSAAVVSTIIMVLVWSRVLAGLGS